MKNLSLITLSVFSLLTLSLQAAETDQFYASSAVIRDSSDEMNGFFHERIAFALNEVNQETGSMSCRLVAKEILDHVLGKFSLIEYIRDRDFSKVSVFSQTSPLIERFPDDGMSGKEYRSTSIYRNSKFYTRVVAIARTLNLNGIYIGTDKMGHFSIVGRTYYKNFLKGLNNGMTPDEAQTAAIKRGFRQEIAVLGYAIGGTLSYGDLEANYQGLQFGRNMCEGASPYLIQVGSKWVHNPNHLFDIRKYVNPKFDEAFNVSFWSPAAWKKMKGDIVREYCKNNKDPNFQERAKVYNKLTKSTINDVLLAEFLKEKPKYSRFKQLLSKDIKCDEI